MSLSLVTPPLNEPLRLEDVKQQVQQFTNVDDALLRTFIAPAARERGELATRRAWIQQTWDWFLSGFPSNQSYFEVPKPPLVRVVFLKYTDVAGTVHTLTEGTDYVVEAPAGPRCARGTIALPFSGVWPFAKPQPKSVQIRFVCGYGTTGEAVPAILRQAALMDCATLYLHRESLLSGTSVMELPGSTPAIYRSFRSLPSGRGVTEDPQ